MFLHQRPHYRRVAGDVGAPQARCHELSQKWVVSLPALFNGFRGGREDSHKEAASSVSFFEK